MNILKGILQKISPALNGRNKKLLTLMEAASSDKYNNERIEASHQLRKLLLDGNVQTIQEIFSGNDYSVLVSCLGNEWAKKAKYLWDHCTDYAYMNNMYRRSYRSQKQSMIYMDKNMDMLMNLIKLKRLGFNYDDYFAGKYDKEYRINKRVIADLIAMEINEGNSSLFQQIKGIIVGDNNVFVITREIISGLLKAKNEEGWKLIGDLLLAAKLQEGLRQSILESLDECRLEAFLSIYQLVLEHDLGRFSSVIRAFDTWTGLAISAEKTSSIKKCLNIGYECLTNQSQRSLYLESNDNLQIYMALWAQGIIELVDVESMVVTLMESNIKNRQLTGLYFLSQIQYPFMKSKIAMKYLDIADEEVLAWVLTNANYYRAYGYQKNVEEYNRILQYTANEKQEIFFKLKAVLERLPQKEKIFSPSVFPWGAVALKPENVIGMMLMQFSNDLQDSHLIDDALQYTSQMSVDVKENILNYTITVPKTAIQRDWLFERLADRSSNVRKLAVKSINQLTITEAEYGILEDLLKTKNGELKKLLIQILLEQSPDQIRKMLHRLLSGDNEQRREASLDMLHALKEDEKRCYLYEEGIQIANAQTNLSDKEALIFNKMTDKVLTGYTKDNVFGLVNMDHKFNAPVVQMDQTFDISQVFALNANHIVSLLRELSDLIHSYREYEYTAVRWNNNSEKVVLGSDNVLYPLTYKENREYSFEDYPLGNVWKSFFEKKQVTSYHLTQLYFIMGRHNFSEVKEWYLKLLYSLFPMDDILNCLQKLKDLKYVGHIQVLLGALKYEFDEAFFYQIAKDVMKYILKKVPAKVFKDEFRKVEQEKYYHVRKSKDVFIQAHEISIWNSWLQQYGKKEDFLESFAIRHAFYRQAEYKSNEYIKIGDWDMAHQCGLEVDDEIQRDMVVRPFATEHISSQTNNNRYGRNKKVNSPYIAEQLDKALSRILEIELKRGDLPTEVSHLAGSIGKFYGARFFVDLIIGLGKESFVRGYSYIGADGGTKKEMFSRLLKNSYPAPDDTIEVFRGLLVGKKIKESRLIEAAMYAPQWIELVQEYLNWSGLKMTCWYFHAHVNETFSAEKETLIARYSAITPQEFNDGAFDKKWFLEAYEMIGVERFQQVYDTAKYISAAGNHKRSQMYTDAVLGKLEKAAFLDEIIRSRNKDKLMAFGLLKLEEDKNQDILERYEYIQLYIKESKKYGSMRSASEGRAAQMALKNLALTAGFSDVSRLVWNVEIMKIDAISLFYMPREVEDVTVHLSIDEEGEATIITMKGDSKLKNIPDRLKDEPYIKEIKELQKSLKEQRSRARLILEESMNIGKVFSFEEIRNIGRHPVLKRLIQNLVLCAEGKFGFLSEDGLRTVDGLQITISPQEDVVIAHCVDLFESGLWSEFQKYLFTNEIKQPFKQVFRELYVPTKDELTEGGFSRRYAGHQIQPKKTVALLRKNGWTVSYEDGLQRVFHDQNIIATVYALADWFSPADIESPALETVHFYERKNYKPIQIGDIPRKVFSEVMRDLDLVVSVAHIGGVDPEATLSTIEMRAAIILESVRLFKYKNVRIEGSHCFIQGKFGDYTVHLGSAVVHKQAKGAVYIIPVHSGHRGRIFLPFMDEDPKTAEVLTKVVFLAEDHLIKDPSILEQIRN